MIQTASVVEWLACLHRVW